MNTLISRQRDEQFEDERNVYSLAWCQTAHNLGSGWSEWYDACDLFALSVLIRSSCNAMCCCRRLRNDPVVQPVD